MHGYAKYKSPAITTKTIKSPANIQSLGSKLSQQPLNTIETKIIIGKDLHLSPKQTNRPQSKIENNVKYNSQLYLMRPFRLMSYNDDSVKLNSNNTTIRHEIACSIIATKTS